MISSKMTHILCYNLDEILGGNLWQKEQLEI